MNATKQHFELVARLLKQGQAKCGGLTGRNASDAKAINGALESLAYEFADEFGRTNERFDRSRFLKACGLAVAVSVPGVANAFKIERSA